MGDGFGDHGFDGAGCAGAKAVRPCDEQHRAKVGEQRVSVLDESLGDDGPTFDCGLDGGVGHGQMYRRRLRASSEALSFFLSRGW